MHHTKPSATRTINIKRGDPTTAVAIQWQTETHDELWKKYREKYPDGVCTNTFRKLKPKQIRVCPWRSCLCPHCIEGKEAENILEMRRREIHKLCTIIVMDFSSKFLTPLSSEETQNQWFDKEGINDLVLVLYWKENGIVRTCNLETLSLHVSSTSY